MAYATIKEKVLGSSNTDERKILVDDVNQIRQVIQTGEKDLKTKNVSLLGNTITADNGSNWIRRYGNTFQFYNGSSWQEPSTATLLTFTAGENIAARDVVYLNKTDGKIYKASNSNSDWIGVATSAITSGASGTVYPNGSLVGGFSGLTSGAWYGLSDTAGTLTANENYIVGIAVSATQITLTKIPKEKTNNQAIYAILYNRMENDAQATAPQLNANIQSDLFSCAAGKYSTVCTAETTSTFSTNLYYNCCACTYPQCACMTCCLVCVVCPTHGGTLTNTQSGLNICSVYQISCTTYGVCVCQNVTSCGTLPSIVDYKRINILINFCGSWDGCDQCVYKRWGFGTSVLSNNFTYNFGVRTCSACKSGCFSCDNCVVLTYLCNNCYTVCINGCCVCNISGDTSLSINNWNCMCNTNCNLASSVWWACNSACSNIQIIGWSTLSTSIVSSIKNYATPKNAVMLVTNSVLPAGNCIRYNIKDQAGTVLLCDAIPDAVYSLSSPACCLYAEIYQCVECNLCTPQCMTQYALMYM